MVHCSTERQCISFVMHSKGKSASKECLPRALAECSGTPRVPVPPPRRQGLSTIATEPLALETITENSSVRLKLLIPNDTRLVDETQIMVKATVVLKSSSPPMKR
jgi:hypothetical protein